MLHLNLWPLLGLILLFHLLYDYHWQGSYVSNAKRKSDFILSVHAATWALWMTVPLYIFTTVSWWQTPWLFVSHWAMDWLKCHRMEERTRSHVIDQAVHLLTLVPCVF